MSTLIIDYTHSCRLCLSGHGMRIPIFEDESNDAVDTMLPSKILTCVSIRVEKEDPYPNWICEYCHAKIEDIYEFRRFCNKSDTKLKKNYYSQFGSKVEHIKQEQLVRCQEETVNNYTENKNPEHDNTEIKNPEHDNTEIKNPEHNSIVTEIKQEPPDDCSYENQFVMKTEQEVKTEVMDTSQEQTSEPVFNRVTEVLGHEYSTSQEQTSELVPSLATKIPGHENSTSMKTEVTALVSSLDTEIPGHENSTSMKTEVTALVSSLDTEIPGHENSGASIKTELTALSESLCQPIQSSDMFPHFLELEDKRELRPRHARRVCNITLVCPTCCCPFTYQAAYEKHTRICKKKPFKKRRGTFSGLMCRTCYVQFDSLEAVVSHNEKMHRNMQGKEKAFSCHACNRRFLKRKQLLDHSILVHNQKDIGFMCEMCNKTFQLKGELICHQAQYHRAEVSKNIAQQKVFGCDQCRQSFVHKGEYILHKEFYHGASRLTTRLPVYRYILPKVI